MCWGSWAGKQVMGAHQQGQESTHLTGRGARESGLGLAVFSPLNEHSGYLSEHGALPTKLLNTSQG